MPTSSFFVGSGGLGFVVHGRVTLELLVWDFCSKCVYMIVMYVHTDKIVSCVQQVCWMSLCYDTRDFVQYVYHSNLYIAT